MDRILLPKWDFTENDAMEIEIDWTEYDQQKEDLYSM